MNPRALLLAILLLSTTMAAAAAELDSIAAEYVELTLALGEHDADWVDAYFGPPELRARVRQQVPPLPELGAAAARLLSRAEVAAVSGSDPWEALRRDYLVAQLVATLTRIGILQGARYRFDEEALRLFGFVPRRREESYFRRVLAEIEGELPGKGSLAQRLESYRATFHIPEDRLEVVFGAAMAECRERSMRHIALPEGESFTVEYVRDRPWAGYNWYQGDFRSVIQVNTDHPIRVDRAIDLACHEGYPGHHLYNVLIERELLRKRGWVEYSVYPLMTPQSFIAEGTAKFGVELAFPGEEAASFSRRVLFPLAGLEPQEAARYGRLGTLTSRLAHASVEVARRLLDGEISREEAVALLVRWGLYTESRAEQHVRFIERYRTYVINYSLGEEVVRAHIERLRGSAARWRELERLLSVPPAPSVLGGGLGRGAAGQ